MKVRHLPFLALVLAGLLPTTAMLAQSRSASRRTAMTTSSDPDDPAEMDALTRELWEFARRTPYAAAVRHAERAQERAAKAPQMVALPTGWRIAPAGRQVEVGRLPYEAVAFHHRLVVLNSGYYAAGSEDPEITVVDGAHARVVKTLRVSSLFPSATLNPDGKTLYVSGGSSDSVFALDAQLNLARAFAVGEYVGPIAAIDSTHVAVASVVSDDSAGASGPARIAVLNTATGTLGAPVTAGYFPSAMLVKDGKLYVALVGEHRVLVYDARNGGLHLLHSISTGKAPQSLCADSDRVYIVNSASDEVTAVHGASDDIVARYAVRFPGAAGNARYGAAPTSCAVSGDRLYVTAAGMNAVAVFARSTATAQASAPAGLIPTGWYPTKVLSSNGTLAVVSAKGIRTRRPNPDGPQPVNDERHSGADYVLTLLHGSLGLLPENSVEPALASWTQMVASGSPLYSASEGLRLPIKYVFTIVRENRSYDQVLGDLGRGDGDSSLVLFGENITPVAHQIAREFVTLDRFHADGEMSVLGHSYTTSGYASPFLEWLGNTSYASRYRGYPFGTVPGAYSPAYLWDALEAKDVSYRIYGEPYYLFTRMYRLITERFGTDSPLAKRFYAHSMALADSIDRGSRFTRLGIPVVGRSATRDGARAVLADTQFMRGLSTMFTGDSSLARALATDARFRDGVIDWLTHWMLGYPTWDLAFSDLDRVRLWQQDFKAALASGRVPRFSYLWLPNDHTAGANTSLPNPFQLVAQNDAALGQLIETIAASPIWGESLVIVEEDDAQNGPDHVDATRTVGLLAGPYVKRGAVVSDHYDQISAMRTAELLLGLDPLHLGDAVAVPMFGALTTKADMRPFKAVAPSQYLMHEDQLRFGVMRAKP